MLRRMAQDQAADASGGAAAAARLRGALFAVPRLFVGLTARCSPECDSPSRSPTSPLDLKAFAALGGSLLRSPRSPKSWDSQRVGLGSLVDPLAGEGTKNRLFMPQMRPTKPQALKSYASMPKDCGHLPPELGKTESSSGMSVPCTRVFYGDLKSGPEVVPSAVNGQSFDAGKFPVSESLPVSITGSGLYIGSVSATEVEQSEDYTCVIAHGPNPKTTHIFGDCILEPCKVWASDGESKEAMEGKAGAESYWLVKRPADDAGEGFLSLCFSCKKKLEGSDIYIYRGEKAFCSGNCRDQEILMEEEAEINTEGSSVSACSATSSDDDIFMAGMVVAT